MPRCARVKTNNSIFHVMIRSISEIDLFKDDADKKEYLMKMREYQLLYGFKVYAYCLMDNHAHFVIDANGSDISKVMHSINFSYAMKFNRKYKRHGHLFQDRFKSKIVKDERNLIALTAYIHNNPKDINGYEEYPEKYEFSSSHIFLFGDEDPYEVIDYNYVGFVMGKDRYNGKMYLNLLREMKYSQLEKEMEFDQEQTIYHSCKSMLVRDVKTEEIIDYISNVFEIDSIKIYTKHNRCVTEARALIVILMRSLCNYKCTDICKALGNITQGRVSKLSNIGIKAISGNLFYRKIVSDFIQQYST